MIHLRLLLYDYYFFRQNQALFICCIKPIKETKEMNLKQQLKLEADNDLSVHFSNRNLIIKETHECLSKTKTEYFSYIEIKDLNTDCTVFDNTRNELSRYLQKFWSVYKIMNIKHMFLLLQRYYSNSVKFPWLTLKTDSFLKDHY